MNAIQASAAVVICTHLEDRLDQLAAAVASVERQVVRPSECVIVVDGPADLQDLVRARLPGIRVECMGRRQGLAAARNAGAAAVRSDVIMFLDDDAVASEHWVGLLLDALTSATVIGASGASAPLWQAPKPAWLPEEFLWTVGCSYRGQPTVRTRVRNVYGGCCALRRELFDELGGYDIRLGRSTVSLGGGEEAELGLRALRRWPTASFVYEPAALIQHRVPPDRLRVRYLVKRAYHEGLMKARVTRLSHRALAPEWRFAAGLPQAVWADLRQGIRGDPEAKARVAGVVLLASAVLAGLGVGWITRMPSQEVAPEPTPRRPDSVP